MLETIKSYRKFQETDKKFKNIVFYSEGDDYDHFYTPYVNSCLKNKINFSYISSSKNSPFTKNNFSKFFYIGDSFIRTLFFFTLNCKNLITTMPDLGNFFLKKSSKCQNYIYFFHSMLSMNIIYNHNAFSNYDTILCANKIHANEVKNYFFTNSKVKYLNLGYPKIDELIKKAYNKKKNNIIKSILIAPSWGNESKNYKAYKILILQLIEQGFSITFRPHPMTINYFKGELEDIYSSFNKYKNFKPSHEKNNLNDYLESDLIITDWSGSAIEFALATKKRCIFLETKQKIRNKSFTESENLRSVEIIFKKEVSESFDLNNFREIFNKINFNEYLVKYEQKIDIFREKYLFNLLQTEVVIDRFFHDLNFKDASSNKKNSKYTFKNF